MKRKKKPNKIDKYILETVHKTPEQFFSSIPNECGDCTFCCTAPAIENCGTIPDKAANETCKFCTVKGCSIYEERPKLCREYACLYLTGLVAERPDKAGVAWTFQAHECPGGKVLLMGHCTDAVATSEDPDCIAVMREFLLNSKYVTGVALRDDKVAISYIGIGCLPGQYEIIDIDPDDPNKVKVLRGTERTYKPLL